MKDTRSPSRRVRRPRVRARLCAAALLLLSCATPSVRAAGIFDDDYTPPKPTEPAPAGPRLVPAPPTTSVSVPPTPAEHPTPVPVSPPSRVAEGPAAVAPVAPSVPVAPAVAPAARRAIPAKAAQATSRKLMKELFAKDLSDRSPAGRLALARKLLDEADKVADNATDQFVLLGGTIESAVEAGNLRLCFRAADAMAQAYALDATAVKANAALRLTPRGFAADSSENVRAALEFLDPMESAGDLATASKLVAALQPPAAGDPLLRAAVQKQARDLEDLRIAHDRLAPALEKLKASPDDPTANAAVGRFTALIRGDWEHGLPLMAKEADSKLGLLAKAALADPADPAARLQLAEGWWELAQPATGRTKLNLIKRARADYHLALPGLSGMARSLAEKRLVEADLALGSSAGAGPTASPLPSPSPFPTPSPASRGGTTHLLPLLDEKALTAAGWRRDGSAAVSPVANITHLTLPYRPPAEFDFSVEFTRLNGQGEFGLAFPVGDSTCVLDLSGQKHLARFGKVANKWQEDGNPTRVDTPPADARRHRVIVKVRADKIESELDGVPLCHYPTDGHDLSAQRDFAARSPSLLAVSSYRSEVAFSAIDVTDVHGTGLLARERDEEGVPSNPAVVAPGAGGALLLTTRDVTVHGAKTFFEGGRDRQSLRFWEPGEDYLSWSVEVPRAGDYAVEVTYACLGTEAGSELGVLVTDGRAEARNGPGSQGSFLVADTGGWSEFQDAPAGKLRLAAGRQTVVVKELTQSRNGAANVRRVVLTPAR